jgi:hypothetical protein
MPFDVKAGEALRLQWIARRAELEKALHEQFPEVENWNSRPQIAKLLVLRGWTPEKFTEKKQEPSIDDETLEELPTQFPEFTGLAEHFILGRRLGQLASGNKAWLKHRRQTPSRCSYETGRGISWRRAFPSSGSALARCWG